RVLTELYLLPKLSPLFSTDPGVRNTGGDANGQQLAGATTSIGSAGEPEGPQAVQEDPRGVQAQPAPAGPQDAERGSGLRYRRPTRRDRPRLVRVCAEHGLPPARSGEVPAQEDRRRARPDRERELRDLRDLRRGDLREA